MLAALPSARAGPTLRAEVGDTIVIHYKNGASFANSMHPHGVFYDKASEGVDYGGDGPCSPDRFFRAPLFAARTLNATGQSRVTLSPQ